MFFRRDNPSGSSIQAEKGPPIAPLTNCQSHKIRHQAPPPKIQSLAALAHPNHSPVNTLMAVTADWSLEKATDPLWRKSRTPMPAKVLETMCVKTEEVDRRPIRGSLAIMSDSCVGVLMVTQTCANSRFEEFYATIHATEESGT